VVQSRRTYYMTNRLSRPAQERRATSKRRHAVAAVCTCVQAQLGLAACPAGYTRLGHEQRPAQAGGQAQHMARCLLASWIVARERISRGLTRRHLRRTLSVRGLKVSWPSLQTVRMAA